MEVKEERTVVREDVPSELIYSFRKNKLEHVRIRLMKYKERDVVDFRVFTESLEGPQPTKKGLMMGTSLLPELKKGLHLLEKHYKKRDEDSTTAA